MLTFIKKYALQIMALGLYSMFFTSCLKPPPEIPAGPKGIIVEATVPTKIYSNIKKAELDASKTNSLNSVRTLNYSWACTDFPARSGKPEVKNALQPLAWVENLGIGQYKFQLIVKDYLGNIAESSYSLEVLEDTLISIIPISNAGPDQTIQAPKHDTFLDGTETYSSNVKGRALFFKWTVINQPVGSIPVAISGTLELDPYVIGLQEGIYQFRLEVKNEVGNIGADTMQVTVLPDPLKGYVRIFEDQVWEKKLSELDDGFAVAIMINNPVLFKDRYAQNMDVRVWDEEKKEWTASNKFEWYVDNFGVLKINYPYSEDENIFFKEVGKKTRVQVKLL